MTTAVRFGGFRGDGGSGPRITPLREIDWEQYLRDPSGDTSSLSFVSGLILGAAIGILVALALAPQSGRRMVEQVWHTGIELGTRTRRSMINHDDHDEDETLADEAEQAETELMRRMHAQE